MAVGSLLDTLNVTYEAKLNYNTAFLGDNFAKPGSVYLGAYHIRDAGNVEYKDGLGYFPLTNRSGNTYARFLQDTTANAFYAGWNQEWWKGIGTSVGYLVNNTSNEIGALTTLQPGPGAVIAAARQSFSSVLSIPMSILFKGKRKDDNLGLGYAFIDIAEDDLIEGSEFKDAIEHVFEAYYRMQLTPSMAVIPNVQLIFNGLGMEANEVTAAIGLRMSCSF
jgi:hypothetical protein